MAGLNDIFAPLDNRSWIQRTKDDAVNTVSNWATGAVQGFNEQVRQERALRQIANVDEYGNASPKEGVDPQAVTNQQALTQKAQTNFSNETVKPISYVLGLVNPAPAIPYMMSDAQKSYQKGAENGGVLSGVGNVLRDFTYGGAVDWYNQPDLAQQFHDRPISTTASGILSALPVALVGKGVYDGIKGRTPGTVLPEAPDSTTAKNVISAAEQHLNEGYVWGGDSPDKGFDCSGLVQWAYGQNGIELPRLANDQYTFLKDKGKTFTDPAQLKEGDLVFMNTHTSQEFDADNPYHVTHVGIYVGEGKVLQAGSHGIHTVDLSNFPDIVGYGRAVEGKGEAPAVQDSGVSHEADQAASGIDSDLSKVYDQLNDNEKLFVDNINYHDTSLQDLHDEALAARQHAIDEYSDILRNQIKQPGLDVPMENLSGDQFTRTYSQNYQWFNDLAKEYGYPNANKLPKYIINEAISKIAEDHLTNGYVDPKYGPMVSDAMTERFNGLGAVVDGIKGIRDKTQALRESSRVNPGNAESHGNLQTGKQEPEQFKLETNPQRINEKAWYHGTGIADLTADKLDPSVTNHEGLFGSGVYMTDNPDIAQGYAKARSRKSGQPTIYQAKVNIGKVLDLEKPAPSEVVKIFLKNSPDEYVSNEVKGWANKPGVTTEEIWQAYSKALSEYSHLEMIPSSEFVENVDMINEDLRSLGYDALTHTGGKRTGKTPHQVLIMLDPNDRISQVGRSGQVKEFRTYQQQIEKSRIASNTSPSAANADGFSMPSESLPVKDIPQEGQRGFINNDLKPAMKTTFQTIKEGLQDIRDTLSPVSAGENAKMTAGVMRENLSEMAQKGDRAQKALEEARNYFSKQSHEDNLAFIHNIETGEGQVTPELQEFAKTIREMLDGRRKEIQDLGTGKMQSFIENYFPHAWKDPKRAQSFFASWSGKRPFEGKKSFLKKRSIPTTLDGIEMGLEPISYNPVDLAMLKMREMDKYIMAHKSIGELKGKGLVKFIKATSTERPDGWVKIDDRIGTIYGPPEVKIKEAFDQQLMDSLNKVADNLGIAHIRSTNIGLGRDSAGVWGYTGQDLPAVVTKFGGPESVLAHEIGHQLAYKYGLDDILRNDPKAGPEIARELNMLADKRLDPAEMRQSEQDYVRGRTEPIAAVVEAYVHAPELLKEYAPTVYDRFTKFLNEHQELDELRDIKPSLQIGEGTATQHIDGLVIKGHYYMPAEAARLINNYLSPGLRDKSGLFRGYLGAANVMNQFQLGMSAFHLGFTSMDSIVSKIALGIVKASHGDYVEGLKDLAHAPVAPVENALRGDKLYKEWMQPGSIGGEVGKLVDALMAGGGRVKMDDMYQTNILQSMKDAYRHGNYAGAAGRFPFAIMEQSVKPILEYIVPRQKLGVFADLMRYEMEHNPNMTREQLRETAGKIWDSVDNRLGQLCYDNLFWHKYLKDGLMASVRSVGWNLGTFRELGGAVTDTAAQGARMLRAERPEMTYKMSYGLALPITVGLAGAIIQYMYTGQIPQDMKDLYFPRTGTLDAHGRPQRIELPSYMKDVYAYYEHPGETLINKLHPLISTVADMLKNKDYYGRKIYNEDDSMGNKAADLGKFALKTMMPFSMQGSKYEADLGGDVLSKTLPFVGVTPAPSDVNKTSVERKISELLRARIPLGAKTQEQADKADLKSSLLREMQINGGKRTQNLTAAEIAGQLSHTEAKELIRESKMTPLERNAKKLDIGDIKALIPQAEPQEVPILEKVLADKVKNAKKNGKAVN